MPWGENIEAGLPEPRPDEPSTLRQDIADELADHLECSLRAELHRTPDESEAKRRVLERFGDVRQVARRLWFDALRENIMSKRINIVLSIMTAAICLAALGLMWQLLRQSQRLIADATAANAKLLEDSRRVSEDLLAQHQRANEELVEQNRVANQALLAKLDDVADGEPQSLEWNPVKLRVVSGGEDGPPAEGITVLLYRRNDSDPPQTVSIEKVTDEKGSIDFGLQRTGNYTLYLSTPWGEHLTERLTVKPGEAKVATIVAPQSAPETHAIVLQLDWPSDLKGKGLWAVCDFTHEFREVHGWQEEPPAWVASRWASLNTPYHRYRGRSSARTRVHARVIIDERGKLIGHRGMFQHYDPNDPDRRRSRLSPFPRRPGEEFSITPFSLGAEPLAREASQVEWTGLKHRLVNLAIARPREETVSDETGEGTPLIIDLLGVEFYEGVDYEGRPAMGERMIFELMARRSGTPAEALAEFRERQEQERRRREYTPAPDEENVWTLPLPERLVAQVRKNLSAKSASP